MWIGQEIQKMYIFVHHIERNDSPTDSSQAPHQPTEGEIFRFNAEPSFVHHVYEGADAEDAA